MSTASQIRQGNLPFGSFLVRSPDRVHGKTQRHRSGKVELVEGSGPHFSAETTSLLQRRLKAAALILAFGFGLFLVRRLFVESPLWWSHVVVVVVLSGTILALWRHYQFSNRQLRGLELIIFGLPTIQLTAHQYFHILQFAREGNAALAVGGAKSTVVYFFALIVVYGMFVPNTWRRAVVAVVPMMLAPVGLGIALRYLHRDVEAIASQVGTFAEVSDNLLMLLIGAVCAVFGTHIINALRREAFEAKELGQYRLKRRIGAGGMGEVFLAEHQLLKRPCAIKLIRPEKAGDPQTLLRFEREVRTTARLSHPNTIEIYDYGRTEDGAFFYVMEYLPGMDLAELVKQHGPLPAERVVFILRQVCGALREAHGVGFIHRDIKPANIFAALRGGLHDVTKLLDFGLVKTTGAQASQLTQDSRLVGSPHYMSPEQTLADHAPDARSDIYSLAAVAYFLLTGSPPFDGTSPMKIIISHARDQVIRPSELQPGIPQDLEEIVLQCLSKDPQDRFQDIQALDQALAACRVAGQWKQEKAAGWWQSAQWQSADVSGNSQPTLDAVITRSSTQVVRPSTQVV